MSLGGWSILVRCPHGVDFRAPMRVFYTLDIDFPGCEKCQAEQARPRPAVKTRHAWMARFNFRKELDLR